MDITQITNIPVLGALPNIPKLYASNPNLSFIIDMVLLSVVFGSLLAPLGYRIVKEKALGKRFGAVLGLVFGVASAFALHNAGVTLFTYWLTSAAVAAVVSTVVYKIMRALGASKIWAGIVFTATLFAIILFWFVQSGLWGENVMVGASILIWFIMPVLAIMLLMVLFKATGVDVKDLFGKIFRVGRPPEPTPTPSEPTPPEPTPTPSGPAPPAGRRQPRSLLGKIFGRGEKAPTPPGGPTAPERTAEGAAKAAKTAKDAGDAATASEKEKREVAEEGIKLTDQFKDALMRLLAKIDEFLNKTTGPINKYDVGYVKKLVDAIIPLYDALSQLLGRLQKHVRIMQYYEEALKAAIAWHGTLEHDIEEWKQTVRANVETGINTLRDETVKARLLWAVEQIEKKVTELGNIVNALNPVIARINSQHLPRLQRIKVDRGYAVLYDLLTASPEKLKTPLKYASSSLAKLAGTANVPPDEIRALLENIKKILTPLVTVDAPKLRSAWEGISATHETELKDMQKDVAAWNNQYRFIPTRLNEVRKLQKKLVEDFQAQQAREAAEEKAEFGPPEAPLPDAAAELAGITDELMIQRTKLEPMVESVMVLVDEMNKEIVRTWGMLDIPDRVALRNAFDAAKTKTGYREAPGSAVTSALGSISLQHRRVKELIRTLPAGTPELVQLTQINANLDTFVSAEPGLVTLLTNTREELVAAGLSALSGPRPNLQQIVKEMLRDVANRAMQLLTLLAPTTASGMRPSRPPKMPLPGG